MYYNFMTYGWGHGLWMLFLWPLVVWAIIWKGMALWTAARAGSKGWFVALLLINTAGILDILYIYIFSKKAATPSDHVSPPKL